ncbi:MAG: alpha/beta hydrolase [Rubrivivax sp.]|nr:alpha/beta hydrolase [Rubrivivax sp.]
MFPHPVSPAAPSAAAPAAPRIGRFTLPRGGPVLELAEQGPPPGPGVTTVLMLHGITDTWRSFEPVLPHLPADWHVVSLSQRGHGGSGVPADGDFGTRAFAADAAAFITMRGLAPAVVVGHSMGAANAMRLAIDRPELVRGVVAAAGFAAFGDKPGLVDFIRDTIAAIGTEVPRELAESFQRETVAGPTAPGLVEAMVDECLRTPPAVWRGAFARLLDDDFSDDIGRIAAPVLLPWGSADLFVPEADQQRIVASLRASGGMVERSVYQGTGHALHWEQPERFARELVHFVARLPARGQRAAAMAGGPARGPARATDLPGTRGAVATA